MSNLKRTTNWTAKVSDAEAARRAGARAHYNSIRRIQAAQRRRKVLALLGRYGWRKWGAVSRIARELGVDRATICRDRQWLTRLTRS
jgi:hypothetical protein